MNNTRKSRRGASGEVDALSREHKQIAQWLKQVRFRRSVFGGVSEKDVWKKIGELNDMYNMALLAERARYDALLARQLEHTDAPDKGGDE